MANRKRKQINSPAGKSEVIQAALAKPGIKPPAHIALQDDELPFWESILEEFATLEWTSHNLEIAALFARTLAEIEREQRALRIEGTVIRSEKGHMVVNPRKTIIQMNASAIFAFRRTLALHARARAGEDNRAAGARLGMGKKMQDNAAAVFADDDEDLLAKPGSVN